MSAVTNQQMNLYSMTRIAMTLGPGLGFLIYLHSMILNTRPDIVDRPHHIKDTLYTEIRDNYDFIIVGGGSAGTVLANRLSENPSWTVLLLESGADEMSLTDLPILFPSLQMTPLDWQYKTEPGDRYCKAMVDGRCNWPRGKVLGGSSVLNAMLYVRGNKKDYDRWAEIGNTGWSYNEVLPYFLKSEDMKIPQYKHDIYHGTGGYLTVEHYRNERLIRGLPDGLWDSNYGQTRVHPVPVAEPLNWTQLLWLKYEDEVNESLDICYIDGSRIKSSFVVVLPTLPKPTFVNVKKCKIRYVPKSLQ